MSDKEEIIIRILKEKYKKYPSFISYGNNCYAYDEGVDKDGFPIHYLIWNNMKVYSGAKGKLHVYDNNRWFVVTNDKSNEYKYHLFHCNKEVACGIEVNSESLTCYSYRDEKRKWHLFSAGKEVVIGDAVKSYRDNIYKYLDNGMWYLIHDGKEIVCGIDVRYFERNNVHNYMYKDKDNITYLISNDKKKVVRET